MTITTIDRPDHTPASGQGDTMSVTALDLDNPSRSAIAHDLGNDVDHDLDIIPAERPAGVVSTAGAVGMRTIRKFLRTPQLLVISTVTGAMFLLIFRYVFGGAIDAGSVPYVAFLVPGYIVTSVLFTGGDVAVGFAEDLEKGVTDRFRSLPVSRSALLGGRVIAESALLVMKLAITAAIGFAVGFRVEGGVSQALVAFGLCAAFGFTFMWVFALLGLVSGNAQAAQGMSLMVFPLAFVSSAIVPVGTMPGFLRPIAEHQPVTVMVNAVRSLCLGDSSLAGVGQHSAAYWAVVSLVWCAGLVAVFAPLAVRRFQRT